MKTSFEPVAIDTCRYASIAGSPPGFTRVMAMSCASSSWESVDPMCSLVVTGEP